MPLTGGIIGIGVGLGIQKYPAFKPQKGLEINEFKVSAKSFYTFKVDNVDMAQSDIRILDYNGQPSYEGRVEFRINGRWGSVCKRKITASAGKMICKTLGFVDGKI